MPASRGAPGPERGPTRRKEGARWSRRLPRGGRGAGRRGPGRRRRSQLEHGTLGPPSGGNVENLKDWLAGSAGGADGGGGRGRVGPVGRCSHPDQLDQDLYGDGDAEPVLV